METYYIELMETDDEMDIDYSTNTAQRTIPTEIL